MVKMLWGIFAAVLAATLALELFIPMQPHFAVEAFFGFNAAYGFLACAVLVLIAKAIGLLAKRAEDYYDDE